MFRATMAEESVAKEEGFTIMGQNMPNITIGYGMTENCAVTTQLPGSNFNKPGSVGTVQPLSLIHISEPTRPERIS